VFLISTQVVQWAMGTKLNELEPWARIGLVVLSIVMIAIFFYGVIMWPDAPIKECGAGYCGKHSQAYTVADYRSFKRWETALFTVWPIGIVASLYLRTRKRKVS
jgi:hypothetical protein